MLFGIAVAALFTHSVAVCAGNGWWIKSKALENKVQNGITNSINKP